MFADLPVPGVAKTRIKCPLDDFKVLSTEHNSWNDLVSMKLSQSFAEKTL
jgi:hypothetical protein